MCMKNMHFLFSLSWLLELNHSQWALWLETHVSALHPDLHKPSQVLSFGPAGRELKPGSRWACSPCSRRDGPSVAPPFIGRSHLEPKAWWCFCHWDPSPGSAVPIKTCYACLIICILTDLIWPHGKHNIADLALCIVQFRSQQPFWEGRSRESGSDLEAMLRPLLTDLCKICTVLWPWQVSVRHSQLWYTVSLILSSALNHWLPAHIGLIFGNHKLILFLLIHCFVGNLVPK